MEVDDEPFDTNSPRNRFEKGSSGFNLQRADNAQCVTLQLTTHLKLTSAARDSSNFRRPEDASETVVKRSKKRDRVLWNTDCSQTVILKK